MNLNGSLHDDDPATKLITRAWKDKTFRQELLQNPKSVLEREMGRKLPEGLEIRVLEDSPETRYLVLPMLPYYSVEASDDALDKTSGSEPCPTVGSTEFTSICDCGAKKPEPKPEPTEPKPEPKPEPYPSKVSA